MAGKIDNVIPSERNGNISQKKKNYFSVRSACSVRCLLYGRFMVVAATDRFTIFRLGASEKWCEPTRVCAHTDLLCECVCARCVRMDVFECGAAEILRRFDKIIKYVLQINGSKR